MTTTAAPANIAPAVWARYLRARRDALAGATAERRDDAAYEARHLERTLGIDPEVVDDEVRGTDVEGALSPLARREVPVTALDDHALWVQFMVEDGELSYGIPDDDRHGELIAEITRRHGSDATELTADYAVAMHMGSPDLVRWATDEHEHLIGIATGRIVPTWRRDDELSAVRSHGFACKGCDLADASATAYAFATGATKVTHGHADHSVTVTR